MHLPGSVGNGALSHSNQHKHYKILRLKCNIYEAIISSISSRIRVVYAKIRKALLCKILFSLISSRTITIQQRVGGVRSPSTASMVLQCRCRCLRYTSVLDCSKYNFAESIQHNSMAGVTGGIWGFGLLKFGYNSFHCLRIMNL